jgi:beta-glucosidase
MLLHTVTLDHLILGGSYNKVNGTYASETPLYKEVVCKEWGFEGTLMSDWYGTESTSAAIEAGLDIEMPGPSKARGNKLIEDVKSGQINTKVIDQRVLGVLKLASRSKEVASTANELAGEDEATNGLIRKIASNSMVLLKNENNLLPLKIEEAPKIAVIGHHASIYTSGGGSASGIPQYF